jgi:hypothetical protein
MVITEVRIKSFEIHEDRVPIRVLGTMYPVPAVGRRFVTMEIEADDLSQELTEHLAAGNYKAILTPLMPKPTITIASISSKSSDSDKPKTRTDQW